MVPDSTRPRSSFFDRRALGHGERLTGAARLSAQALHELSKLRDGLARTPARRRAADFVVVLRGLRSAVQPLPTGELAAARVQRRVAAVERALDQLGMELRRPVEQSRAMENAMRPLLPRVRSAVERANADLYGALALTRPEAVDDPVPWLQLASPDVRNSRPEPDARDRALIDPSRAPSPSYAGRENGQVELEDPYGLLGGAREKRSRRPFRRIHRRQR